MASQYPYCDDIYKDWRELYELDNDEMALIKLWDSSISHNSHTATKMISARGAEKLVFQYCKAIGCDVDDISLQQVTGNTDEWKKGDIRIQGKGMLDVKNARTDIHSKVYSEFCIPSFKQDSRSNNGNVSIVVVLSPYLKKEIIDSRQKPNFNIRHPMILGMLEPRLIKDIKDYFESTENEFKLSIELSRKNERAIYMPPWLFDFGNKFYEDQIKCIQAFKSDVIESDLPSYKVLQLLDLNLDQLVMLFLVAKIKVPEFIFDVLPNWQKLLVSQILELPPERITLPWLFLSMLRHFLGRLKANDSDFSPTKYKSALFRENDKKIEETFYRPLGIYDPLHIINDFCDAFEVVWQSRSLNRLQDFTFFSFNGQGLLRGKSKKQDSWITILAYCGGRIDGKGKCGFSPLVLGKHSVCPECSRLICPAEDCLFCSQNCLNYSKRKATVNLSDSFSNIEEFQQVYSGFRSDASRSPDK